MSLLEGEEELTAIEEAREFIENQKAENKNRRAIKELDPAEIDQIVQSEENE